MLRGEELQRRCLQREWPELFWGEKLYRNDDGMLQGYFAGLPKREISETHERLLPGVLKLLRGNGCAAVLGEINRRISKSNNAAECRRE